VVQWSTMREVAERAGVSAKTVSRVINHKRYISADVRSRVEAAVAELAYVPNSLARTFRSGRDAAVGIAVPDVADPFFAVVIHAIERIARERGAAVFVTSLGDDGQYEQPAVEALLGRQVAGLITTPVAAARPIWPRGNPAPRSCSSTGPPRNSPAPTTWSRTTSRAPAPRPSTFSATTTDA